MVGGKMDVKVYKNVEIAEGSKIEGPCVIGCPPRGKEDGELKTVIGKNAVIRPFSSIYAGTTIGDDFQTGHGAFVREDNIIGNNVSIGTNAVLEFGNRIGNNVRIHSNCFLEWVTVEDHVFIGPNVVFTNNVHPAHCPKFLECVGGATLKKKSKVGAGSVILPGVVIGENALVGAASVVTKDVPKDAVVKGVPARMHKNIDELECLKGFFKKPYMWEPYIEEDK